MRGDVKGRSSTNAFKIVVTGILSVVARFDVAIVAWVGLSAFLEHAAFRALVGVTIVLSLPAVFSGGRMKTGCRGFIEG